MGMCFSDERSASSIRPPRQEQSCVRELKGAELIIDINPQNVPETQADLLSPCPTVISISSSLRSRQSKARSMISLEEALMNENMQLQEDGEGVQVASWMQSHNTPSSLMKMTKSKNAGAFLGDPSRASTKSMITQLQKCDLVSASLTVNHRTSSIVFSSVDLDIEFILPKGRAGPLVVPYICYENYSTRQQKM